jgi:hypothetical protein
MKVLEKPFKSPVEPRNDLDNKIYEYLRKNAVGYEKRVKSNVLMQQFNITDNKTLRSHIESIRDNMDYELIVCSEAGSNGGYYVATTKDEVYDTLAHLYNRAMKMLKTYSKIKRRYKLDKQMILKLDQFEKEIYKSIMEVNNECKRDV